MSVQWLNSDLGTCLGSVLVHPGRLVACAGAVEPTGGRGGETLEGSETGHPGDARLYDPGAAHPRDEQLNK